MLALNTVFPEYNSSQESFLKTREKFGLDSGPKKYDLLNAEQRKELDASINRYYTFGQVNEVSSSPKEIERLWAIQQACSSMGLFIAVGSSFLGLAVTSFVAGGLGRSKFPLFMTLVWGVMVTCLVLGGAVGYSLSISHFVGAGLYLLLYLLGFLGIGLVFRSLGRRVGNYCLHPERGFSS